MISVVGHTHATVQCRTRKIQRRRRRHSTVPLPSTTGFTIARVLFCCCFIDPCGSAQFRTRNRTISEAARLPHDNHPAVLAFPILRKRNVFGSTDHPIFYSHFFKPVALRCAESSRRARTTTNEYGCAPRAVSRIHLHKLKWIGRVSKHQRELKEVGKKWNTNMNDRTNERVIWERGNAPSRSPVSHVSSKCNGKLSISFQRRFLGAYRANRPSFELQLLSTLFSAGPHFSFVLANIRADSVQWGKQIVKYLHFLKGKTNRPQLPPTGRSKHYYDKKVVFES